MTTDIAPTQVQSARLGTFMLEARVHREPIMNVLTDEGRILVHAGHLVTDPDASPYALIDRDGSCLPIGMDHGERVWDDALAA